MRKNKYHGSRRYKILTIEVIGRDGYCVFISSHERVADVVAQIDTELFPWKTRPGEKGVIPWGTSSIIAIALFDIVSGIFQHVRGDEIAPYANTLNKMRRKWRTGFMFKVKTDC